MSLQGGLDPLVVQRLKKNPVIAVIKARQVVA
jgi:hypothetical protein